MYTSGHSVQRSTLDAFCVLSHLIVPHILGGRSLYHTDKETKLQRSHMTCSDLCSWDWVLDLSDFKAQITDYTLLPFPSSCCHPAPESRLSQVYVDQVPEMGWVHAFTTAPLVVGWGIEGACRGGSMEMAVD